MYKRVLLKISGEALGGQDIIDYGKIDAVAEVLFKLQQMGVQTGVVPGGGNIFRGRASGSMDRTDADHMGMLATAINSLALKDAVSRLGGKACVMSAIPMYQVCEDFSKRDADQRLSRGETVIFACGTGRPYFSTDTAAALRALEIGAEVLLCAKNIDGVYSADPKKDPTAVKYDRLSFDEIVSRNLKALDQAALALCRDYSLPVFVFKLDEPMSIIKAVEGAAAGTHIF